MSEINLQLDVSKDEFRQKLGITDPIPFILEGEQVIEKINELPTGKDDPKIDASHIKNLPKSEIRMVGGGSSGVKEIIAGTNITVDNSKLGYPEISATSVATDVSGLVPYTGALNEVDLGSNPITAYGVASNFDITIKLGRKFIFDG